MMMITRQHLLVLVVGLLLLIIVIIVVAPPLPSQLQQQHIQQHIRQRRPPNHHHHRFHPDPRLQAVLHLMSAASFLNALRTRIWVLSTICNIGVNWCRTKGNRKQASFFCFAKLTANPCEEKTRSTPGQGASMTWSPQSKTQGKRSNRER